MTLYICKTYFNNIKSEDLFEQYSASHSANKYILNVLLVTKFKPSFGKEHFCSWAALYLCTVVRACFYFFFTPILTPSLAPPDPKCLSLENEAMTTTYQTATLITNITGFHNQSALWKWTISNRALPANHLSQNCPMLNHNWYALCPANHKQTL